MLYRPGGNNVKPSQVVLMVLPTNILLYVLPSKITKELSAITSDIVGLRRGIPSNAPCGPLTKSGDPAFRYCRSYQPYWWPSPKMPNAMSPATKYVFEELLTSLTVRLTGSLDLIFIFGTLISRLRS